MKISERHQNSVRNVLTFESSLAKKNTSNFPEEQSPCYQRPGGKAQCGKCATFFWEYVQSAVELEGGWLRMHLA